MPEDKLKKYYDHILKLGKVTEKEIGGYDAFRNNLQYPNQRKHFYETLLSRGLSEKQLGSYGILNNNLERYYKQNNITAARTVEKEEVNINDAKGDMIAVTNEQGKKSIRHQHDINPETVVQTTKQQAEEVIRQQEEEANKPQPETVGIRININNKPAEFNVIADPNTNIATLDTTFSNAKDAEKVLTSLNDEYPMEWSIDTKQTKNGFLTRNEYIIKSNLENSNSQNANDIVKNAPRENKNETQSREQEENVNSSAEEKQKWDAINEENKNLPWIKRYQGGNTQSVKNEDGTVSTHKLAYSEADGKYYVYPTIIEKDGDLIELSGKSAWEYAMKHHTAISFDDEAAAAAYSKNGLIDHRTSDIDKDIQDLERRRSEIIDGTDFTGLRTTPRDLIEVEKKLNDLKAKKYLTYTKEGQSITDHISSIPAHDRYLTTKVFDVEKEQLMHEYGNDKERAIDLAINEDQQKKDAYYLKEGLKKISGLSTIKNDAMQAALSTFDEDEAKASQIISDIREASLLSTPTAKDKVVELKKELQKLGYDPNGWMNYKTGLRNKEGSFEGYAKQVNETVETLKDTPADELEHMTEAQFVRYNYLKKEYEKATEDKRIDRTGTYSMSREETAQMLANDDVRKRLEGTKEIPGELARARATFEGISRAYFLNENPQNAPSSKLHTLGKSLIENSTILNSIKDSFGIDTGVGEIERKQGLQGLFDRRGFAITKEERDALKTKTSDKIMKALGATGGVLLDFAALDGVGALAGVPEALASMRVTAAEAKAAGQAYRLKQLKTFLAESLYEEVKFGAVGGHPGQGTLFGVVGKVLNKVPYLTRKPFDKWYIDVPKNLIKADISMTSTMYTVDAINATADALVNDKEWVYQLQKHFGNNLGEFGEKVMTDLATNWLFGLKETMALSYMDKATLIAEGKFMYKFAKDNGLNNEAEAIKDMVGGFKDGDITGREVLTRIRGRNTYYQARAILNDMNNNKGSEIFKDESFKAYKKEIADIISAYDKSPSVEDIEKLNRRVHTLKDKYKEQTKIYLEYRKNQAKRAEKRAEQTEYVEKRLTEDGEAPKDNNVIETEQDLEREKEKLETIAQSESEPRREAAKQRLSELEKPSLSEKIKLDKEKKEQEKKEQDAAVDDYNEKKKQEEKEKQQAEVDNRKKTEADEATAKPSEKQSEPDIGTQDQKSKDSHKSSPYDKSKKIKYSKTREKINKNLSEEEINELDDVLKQLKKKLGNLNIGIDPETMLLANKVAYLVIKSGSRKFVDFVKQMVEMVGEGIQPHLKSMYEYVKNMEEADPFYDEMTDSKEVRKSVVGDILRPAPKDLEEGNNKIKDRKPPIQHKIRGKETKRAIRANEDVHGRLAIIDASDLQPSHLNGVVNPNHGISKAQPKQYDSSRERASDNIASNPDWDKISDKTTNIYSGAPTVNSRGEVIQGNNRAIGLRKYWGGADLKGYKDYLKTHAEELGLKADDIDNFENPVLVNMLDVDDDEAIRIGQYTSQDLETGSRDIDAKPTVRKLGAENTNHMVSEIILANADGTLKAAIRKNGAEALKFMHRKGAIDDSQIITATDKNTNGLTKKAVAQLEDIVKYNLLEKSNNVNIETYFERLRDNVQVSIIKGLANNINNPENIIDREILEAIELYGDAYTNEKGDNPDSLETLDNALKAVNMFTGKALIESVDPLTLALTKLMITSRNQKDISDKIKAYTTLVNGERDTMFPIEPITKQEAVKQIFGVDLQSEQKNSNLAKNNEDDNPRSDIDKKQSESNDEGVSKLHSDSSENPPRSGSDVGGLGRETIPTSGRQTSNVDSGGDVPIDGETANNSVPTNKSGDEALHTGSEQSKGSIALDAKGVSHDGQPNATNRTDDERGFEDLGDNSHKESIIKDLPELYPGQQEDVFIAEKRFEKGKGMLFTNGTGVGKTYTGLGIVKRNILQGKGNIAIIVPTAQKVSDWIKDGERLSINITPLENKSNDIPEGVIITTYANMYDNEKLQNTDFSLVVYDESHKLGQNSKGAADAYIAGHRKLVNLPSWAKERAVYVYPYPERPEEGTPELHEWYSNVREIDKKRYNYAIQLVNDTKVVMLSATPFAYHKSIQIADGLLWEFDETLDDKQYSGGYNTAIGFEKFLVNNLGYRMRYNKVTIPESGVDVDLLEKQLYEKSVKEGIISGRVLDVDFDYSRTFIQKDNDLADAINDGIMMLKMPDDAMMSKYPSLTSRARKRYSYLYINQLLESLKAKQAIDRISEHLEEGRKIVVFHSYNNNTPSHPFRFTVDQFVGKEKEGKQSWKEKRLRTQIQDEINKFNDEFSYLVDIDMSDLQNTREAIIDTFGDRAVEFNGTVPKNKRNVHTEQFNDSDSGVDIIIVQRAAGKEGISLHDTDGKKQRVLIDLGLPTAPTDAIQSEGRIYRLGVKSNAIYEYLIVGTDFEKIAFAQKVAERSKTVENLSLGYKARALSNSFIEGYKNASYPKASEATGEGGKESDRILEEQANPFSLAKTLYYSRQKRTRRTKSQEGVDYYATPEPIGMKMVEWLGLEANESALEPSAGHGAIARFFPNNTSNTFIEPSGTLSAELTMNANGNIKRGTFEDLNIVNKYHGIAMNPPYGRNSKTAMEHVEKGFKHLKKGGRLIAIVPNGPSMRKRLDKFLYGEDEKGNLLNPAAILRAEIQLPTVTFKRAGTNVSTKIIVIDNIDDVGKSVETGVMYDYSHTDDINNLFDELEFLNIPNRVEGEQPTVEGSRSYSIGDISLSYVPHNNTKTGEHTHKVSIDNNVPYDTYKELKEKAKTLGGYYSKYQNKDLGIKKGFIFESEEKAKMFIDGNTLHEPSDKYTIIPTKEDYNAKTKALKEDVKLKKALSIKAKNKYYRLKNKSEKDADEQQVDIFGNASNAQTSLLLGEDNKKDILLNAQKEMTFSYNEYVRAESALKQHKTISPNQTELAFESNIYEDSGTQMTLEFESMATDEMKKQQEKIGYGSGETKEVVSERILSVTGVTFMGDGLHGPLTIKSTADIAYIFKNLEKAGVEHSFAVMMDGNDEYKVLYVSSGGTTSTLVDNKLIVSAAVEFGAKKVVFVHNHPTGTLKASEADYRVHDKLSKALSSVEVDMLPGIIINLDSGKYSVFSSDGGGKTINEKQGKHSFVEGKGIKNIDVYQFDRQRLYKPSTEKTIIKTKEDVAVYLSKIKRGTTPKIHAIILDNTLGINKVLLYDETITKERLAGELLYEVGKHGETVILGSNKEIKGLDHIKKMLSKIGSSVLDVVKIKQDAEIVRESDKFLFSLYKRPIATAASEMITDEFIEKQQEFNNKLRDEIDNISNEIGINIQQHDTDKSIRNNDIDDDTIVKAYYDKATGDIHVIVGNIDSIEDARRAILHEAVGHKGIKAILGDEYDMFMDNLYKDIPDNEKKIIEKRGYDANDHRKISEEWVAYKAETYEGKPVHSLLKRVYSKLRALLRKVFNIRLSKDDLDNMVYSLLKRSRKAIKADTPKELSYAINNVDTSAESFNIWFKNSKVVDETGTPIWLYKNKETGVWSEDGDGINAVLSIQNPKYTNEEISNGVISDAKDNGYDGIIREPDGKKEYVPFDEDQIKESTVSYLLDRKNEAKSELTKYYEKEKAKWLGLKNTETTKAIIEADGYQKRIKDIFKQDKPKGVSTWKELDEAAQIYGDLLPFPDKIKELSDKIGKIGKDKKRLLKISQNLPQKVKDIVQESVQESKNIGDYALSKGVIGNQIEGYLNRNWEIGNKSNSEFWRTFGTSTRHSKKRKLETILDGWTLEDDKGNNIGLNLKTKGLTNNLAQLKKEIYTTVANKEFIEHGMLITDAEGNKLFTTNNDKEGYARINHPNFKRWAWAGELKPGIVEPVQGDTETSEDFTERYTQWIDEVEKLQPEIRLKEYGSHDIFITKEGVVFRKKDVYAPEPIAKRINNILDPSKLDGVVIQKITKVNAIVKKSILSGSFFHHQAYLRSYLWTSLFNGNINDMNPIKAYKDGVRMMQDFTPEFELLLHNGLTVGRNQEWDESIVKQKGIVRNTLDKYGVAIPIRKKVTKLFDDHTDFLFGTLGAGLKVKSAVIELRHQVAKYPDLDINEAARRSADLVNADFGGLPLDYMERSKTANHWMQLLLLAKDWTESNVLTVLRGFGYDYTRPKGQRILDVDESKMYKSFWARAILRVAQVSLLGNLILATFDGDDDDTYIDTVIKRYKYAFQDADKLNWLKWDITPVYQKINELTGQETDEDVRKYYSLLGHFQDPFKWVDQAITRSFTTPIKNKGSWIMHTFFNLLTGETWNGKRYTSVSEFLGIDDKGTYYRNKRNPEWKGGDPFEGKYLYMAGDPKGGKHKGQLTKWDYSQKGPTETTSFPSFVLSTVRGAMPIPIQNIMLAFSGEMEYFDAFTHGVGAHVNTHKVKREDLTVDFDSRLKDAKTIIMRAKTLEKENQKDAYIKLIASKEYKAAEKIKEYNNDIIKDLETDYEDALDAANDKAIDLSIEKIEEAKSKYIEKTTPNDE